MTSLLSNLRNLLINLGPTKDTLALRKLRDGWGGRRRGVSEILDVGAIRCIYKDLQINLLRRGGHTTGRLTRWN